jgi:two-component system, NtrC family, response regulator
VDSAELATRRGAWSYIVKGPSVTPILNALSNVLDYQSEKSDSGCQIVRENEGIIGESHQLRACVGLATQAAASNATVLITGETGTGKELFARAIHNHCPRHLGNFVVVDCAALPDALVESILFGHTKGAFTGADRVRDGLVKQADGGTLFLDEVGELPLSLQGPFLRVLQEHRFRPVGSDEEVESDFRLIAATNRDLEVMARESLFRKDLFYRLQTFEIHLPPLREREDDIERIALHHVARICERYEKFLKRLSPESLEVLNQYPWPGNVRELVRAIESAIVAAQQQETVFAKHLPENIRVEVARQVTAGRLTHEEIPQHASIGIPSLKQVREAAGDAAEKDYLANLMDVTLGDISQACSASGLSRSRLYALLKRHGIGLRR